MPKIGAIYRKDKLGGFFVDVEWENGTTISRFHFNDDMLQERKFLTEVNQVIADMTPAPTPKDNVPGAAIDPLIALAQELRGTEVGKMQIIPPSVMGSDIPIKET